MADYYPLLARAVAALPDSTPETRRSIYERARKALLGQLRRVEPPVPEADIQRENDALDAAIARLEGELEAARGTGDAAPAPQTAPPPPAPSPPAAPAAPKAAPEAAPPPPPSSPAAPPARPVLGAAPARSAQPAAPPPAPAAPPAVSITAPKGVIPPRVEPTIPAPDRAASRPSVASSIARERIWPPPSRAAVAAGEGSAAPQIAPPKAAVSPAAAPTPSVAPTTMPTAGVAAGFSAVPPVVAKAPEAHGAPVRPVLPIVEPEAKHPVAPEAEATVPADRPEEIDGEPVDLPRKAPGTLSKLRFFGRAREKDRGASFDAALDDASGGEPVFAPAAPMANEALRPVAPQAPVQRTSNLRYWLFAAILLLVVGSIATLAFRLRDNPEDFTRVMSTSPSADGDGQSGKIVERIGAGPSASGQRAASQATPAPQTSAPRAPAPQTATAPAAQTPIIPVAHRAALLIEAPDDPQRVRTFVGTVLWRIDRAAGAPPALVADIDLPDARFKATFRISKNTDPRLPASHTIDLRFTTAPDGEIPDVKEVDTLQMRAEDRPAGEALSGIPAAITTNYFLIGLSGSDSAQSRNIDLMRNRAWFDLPMLLVNGKIAKITFEKGTTGERMLNEVLAAWKSS